MPEGLSPSEQRKLVGILSRLASEHDGERAAAGLLATRLLKSAGVTWDQVVGVPAARPRLSAPAWRSEIEACLKHAGLLTQWERRFLRDLLSRGVLSTRQHEKVRQIAQQLRERCAP
jgi:hypothetical protein